MIRIVWKVGEQTGCGNWFPENSRQILIGIITACNKQLGGHTHWIEEQE